RSALSSAGTRLAVSPLPARRSPAPDPWLPTPDPRGEEMANEIKLPRLKENVDSYEVTEVLVTPGQAVAKDQPILVVNADKSNLEVYAPLARTLVKLNVKVGDEIKIASAYCVIQPIKGAAPAPA